MVTKEQAMKCRTFYTKEHKLADGSHQEIRANGACKTWKRDPARFELPVKWGWRTYGYITNHNCHEFYTEPPPNDSEWEKFDFRYETHKKICEIAAGLFKSICTYTLKLTDRPEIGRCVSYRIVVLRKYQSEIDWLAMGDWLKDKLPLTDLRVGEDDVLCVPCDGSKWKANPNWVGGLDVFVKCPQPVMSPPHVQELVNVERLTIPYGKQTKDHFVPGEQIVRIWNSVPQASLDPFYYCRTWTEQRLVSTPVGPFTTSPPEVSYDNVLVHQIKVGNTERYFVRTNSVRYQPYCLHYRPKIS